MIIGNKVFDNNTVHIMGILNVTPDSFYDGNRYINLDSALKRAENIVNDGADIIDVGGESTRPGYTEIDDSEEIERVVPVIEAIKKEFDIPISLDTYKYKVAAAGIRAGADMINDIWGFKYAADMPELVAGNKVSCCLMHNRDNNLYNNLLEDIISDIDDSIHRAVNAGIDKDRIMIDPGIGFAKDTLQNLETVKKIEQLKVLEYPVLLGVSRKSLIGNLLNIDKEERMPATLALGLWGMLHGVSWLRVHDVKEHVQAISMLNYLLD